MPFLEEFDLQIEVDHVLRSQGVDPNVIRGRNPRIVEFAERALEEGVKLLAPKVQYQEFSIDALRHEKLMLSGGKFLSGVLISQFLAPAQKVIGVLCTVGDELENQAIEVVKEDPVYGLALDAVGSAATETLANISCNYFEGQAKNKALQTTIPLSPGMVGWTVEAGQPQIFDLLDSSQAGISLTPSFLMLPRKTLSMVIGVGPDLEQEGRVCDYCVMQETCKYQDHYAKVSVS
ncbi:MAG: hypothetical protein FVQ83_14980 [Chloroflexi bacterium]|nr:hypothetical protein [Chloroflexota bacterium]